MLGTRLLFRKRREEKPVNLKFLAWIAVAILVVFVFMRFFQWIDDAQRSLLPQTESLAILDDLTSLNAIIDLPTQTFGAELYTAGIYTSSIGEIPEGSIVTVYTKDAWRFVEIDYFPGVNSAEYLATHIYPTQEVKLDQETSVWIQTLDDRPRCIDYEDGLPNRCEITRHLIAQLENHLLLIAADGDHPTDGELIEMARSIMFFDDESGE
ncbi:MAG: hypothetical protein UY76_C0021G0017 [Candidatus Uhrbacteria bacterium GW2011_GWA2_52_8d]|uniref:Uncharacterized protein n=1 Tax=Candidatus Uhrbacteria bacterium GW2011_GWA2_52_8d TaxID=1618979 RepID=A0A0G1XP08_9BACT|nr:MAG: hypothetical protein UY76_C0021G0017 [Candidatus Uhrbacteria bacterium GW2011_GWA2_52_8d]